MEDEKLAVIERGCEVMKGDGLSEEEKAAIDTRGCGDDWNSSADGCRALKAANDYCGYISQSHAS